jgi:hypothetical protein
MSPVQRIAATRNGLAALLVAQALSTAVACAEGEAQLLLPLVAAVAVGVSAVESTTAEPVHGGRLTDPPPPRRHSSLLPARIHIPDAYALDFDRTPPRFVSAVDSDRVVAFDLMPRRRHGWMASLTYDEESRRPLPGSGDLLRLQAEIRF